MVGVKDMSIQITNSGVTFPDNSIQTTAALDIGVSQTWKAVSRSFGVAYYNTTVRPIFIAVTAQVPTGGIPGGLTLTINGITSISSSYYWCTPIYAIVPPGGSYYGNAVGSGYLYSWCELS
jgi:hypothetical protein